MRRRLSGLWMVINQPPCDEISTRLAVDSTRYSSPELLQLLTPEFLKFKLFSPKKLRNFPPQPGNSAATACIAANTTP